MSDRFQIYKTPGNWFLQYPNGFDETDVGKFCETFEHAVAEFIKASEQRCITCDRGAVVDRPWGWECTACGSYDVAVGCTR